MLYRNMRFALIGWIIITILIFIPLPGIGLIYTWSNKGSMNGYEMQSKMQSIDTTLNSDINLCYDKNTDIVYYEKFYKLEPMLGPNGYPCKLQDDTITEIQTGEFVCNIK